jgi:hypothetical protein
MNLKGEQWYTLKEVAVMSDIPQLRSEYLIKKWIDENKLKAVKVGKGKGARYSIKGVWLAAFVSNVEAGNFRG